MSVDQLNLVDMVSYDELYKILFAKFKASHDEIKYWVMLSKIEKDRHYFPQLGNYLTPFQSDLPLSLNPKGTAGSYIFTDERFLNPEFCFYKRKEVEEFIPPPYSRFVYLKDLAALRNWSDYKIDEKHTKIFELLKLANESGILRFYDPILNEFTLTKKQTRHIMTPDAALEKLWSHTFDGEAYCANPDSFFLLFDILTIERVFFNKDYNLCLEELYGKSAKPPHNVLSLCSKTYWSIRE